MLSPEHRCRAGLLLAIALAVAPLAARSDASVAPNAAPVTAADDAKPTAELIPARDIPQRADTDERFAKDVVLRLSEVGRTVDLDRRLDELDAGVRKLSVRVSRDDLRQLPVMRLESLERHWAFYERQFETWRRDQQLDVDRYAEEAAQLSSRRASWQRTRAESAASGIAPALLSRIDGVSAQLEAAQQALSAPLGARIESGRRAASLQTTIDAAQASLERAIGNYDRRLRSIDAPPYRQLWGNGAADVGALKGLRDGLELDTDFMHDYLRASPDKFKAHAAFALLSLPLLLWLSARSRRTIAGKVEPEAASHTLTRPISSWAVLVLVSTLFFEADAPLLLHEAALMLALIPMLRLLPQRLFDLLSHWPYVATALYVLHRLGFVLIGIPFWHRTHLLVMTVLSLLALLWLVISARRREAPAVGSQLRSSLRLLGWVGVLALSVSLVANLVGNVSLAITLTSATLNCAYVGLVLYAGAAVLTDVVRLLLAERGLARFSTVARHSTSLLQILSRLIGYAAAAVWFIVILNEFRVFRPVWGAVRSFLALPLEAGKISVTPGSIALFALSIYLAFWIARTVRILLAEDLLPNMALPRGVANSVSTLTYYSLLLVGLLVALAAAGFQVSQLTLVFGALGVGIGFGLQNVVNNFVSGLILMFERPIQPGDVIDVAGVSGTVRDIGMRATTLEGFEGADIVVPNGTLLSEKLVNWTLKDMNRRLDVAVGVAYGSDPRRVVALLEEVARSTERVLTQPEPMALFVGFGQSSLDFALRCWTGDFDNWVRTRSELTLRVHEALGAEGIAIPFPQRDLHVRSLAPELRAELLAAQPRPG